MTQIRNVCIVTPHFPPKVTGMSVSVLETAKKLSEVGCEVHVVTPIHSKMLRFESSFLLHPVTCQGLSEPKGFLSDSYQVIQGGRATAPFYVASVQRVKDIIEDFGVDVVHIHSSYDDYVAGYVGVKVKETFPRIPVILTVHGGGKEPTEKERRVRAAILNKIDRVITVSNSLKQGLLACGVLPGKVVTIPNGIDLERFGDVRSGLEVRRKLCIGDGEPVVLYVGRLDPDKGVTYLLSTFTKVLRELPDAKLLLVGDGYLKGFIKEIVAKLYPERSVVIEGFLPYEAMPELYAAADVVVLPSVRREACPMTLLEAMASRKPVVATIVQGTTEIIVNGQTGLLVTPRNTAQLAKALVKLLTNKKLAAVLAENGYERVRKCFDIGIVVKQLLLVYQEASGEVVKPNA